MDNHPDEVAQWYADTLKPGISKEDLTTNLSTLVFHNHPVGSELVKHIKASVEDLKLTKVIDPATDPEEFANRITLDIFA